MPKPTKKLKLPHPELMDLIEALKANVTRVGACEVEGTEVR